MRLSLLGLTVPVLIAGLTTSCSDPVPPTPRGAWYVAFVDPGGACSIQGHNASLGKVTDTDRANASLVTSGEAGADITCSVVGSSSFNIDATAYQSGSILQMVVEGISSSATETNPAKGSIAFASPTTVATYASNDCSFYFIPDSGEGIGPGKVWVAFSCDAISSEGSVCQIKQGYAIFENCSTGSE